MMKSTKISNHLTILSVLRYTLFLSALTATGCAYSPQAVPPWAAEKVDVPGARVFLGGLHATLMQTVPPAAKEGEFVFLSKGELKGWEWPLAQATWYRFNLYSRDGTNLCEMKDFAEWKDQNPGWMFWLPAAKLEIRCPYSDAFLLPPLRATFEWRFTEHDREGDIIPELTRDTSYYIVSDSIICKEIDPVTHKCI